MENPSAEEENIIKDIRNLFRLEKETKATKGGILRDTQLTFTCSKPTIETLEKAEKYGES